MSGSIWFGARGFEGGLVAAGDRTAGFLESKNENDEYIAFLASCNVPFLAWVPIADGIELRESFSTLMLWAEDDILVREGTGGPEYTLPKDKVTCLVPQNFRDAITEKEE